MRLLYSYMTICLPLWVILITRILETQINWAAAVAGAVLGACGASGILISLHYKAKKGQFILGLSGPRWLFFLIGFFAILVGVFILVSTMHILSQYMSEDSMRQMLLTLGIVFGAVVTTIVSIGIFILEKGHDQQFWLMQS